MFCRDEPCSRPVARGLLRRARPLLILLAVVALACGCQAKVAVDAKVNPDGSGLLSFGVGLDDKALTYSGDPDRAFMLDDLPAAGWTVTKATKEADGLTWIRVSKPFANATELSSIMAELTGKDAMFRDFTFVAEDSPTSVTYHLKGTLDPTKGLAPASDPQLAAAIPNQDGFGGFVSKVEAQEGKPVSDMVSFDVTASVAGGPPQSYHPSLKDTAPTPVDVSTVVAKPPTEMIGWGAFVVGALAIGLVVVMLVGARRRFRHSH
jgi:hypothetical protein